MFKQPADNPNATPEEEKAARERIRPAEKNPAEDRERAAELALRLANEAGKPEAGSEEYEQAKEILWNRKNNIDAKP